MALQESSPHPLADAHCVSYAVGRHTKPDSTMFSLIDTFLEPHILTLFGNFHPFGASVQYIGMD